MAKKPQNDIEKLLSDYAKQRRDDAGTPQLHPVTRRVLQSEVRREFPLSGETRARPTPSRWSILWPRIAAACSVMAAITVVLVMVNPRDNDSTNSELALNKRELSTPVQPAGLPPASGPASSEALTAADRRPDSGRIATKGAAELDAGGAMKMAVASETETVLADAAVNSPAMANVQMQTEAVGDIAGAPAEGQTTGARGGRGNRTAAADQSAAPSLLAAAAPQPSVYSAEASTGQIAPASRMSKSGAADAMVPAVQTAQLLNNSLTQRYRNVAVIEQPQPAVPAPAVLVEFTVEQNGNEMKIVDRDGSVYNGTISNLVTDGLIASDIVATPYAAADQSAVAGASQSAATLQAGNSPRQAQQLIGGGRGGGGGGFGGAGGGVQAQNFNEQQNYVFRVEGTNRSLQQRVVFTGNMIQNTLVNSAQNNLFNFSNTQQFRQQTQAQQAPGMNTLNLQMPNNFINGRVVLDDGKMSTEMSAMPVDP